MGLAGFPESGSQIRRKADGMLGEVYATDPPARLSVRWPTVPGAYGHEDCTPEQFARAWELTGARFISMRNKYLVLGLIAATVILFFVAVLVHDTRSAYTGYDPYKPLAADSAAILDSARALNAKYGMMAAEACAAGADEYVRSITRHRFHWESGDTLVPRFDHFGPTVTAPGVLTMITDKVSVSNGFGIFHPVEIACNYDTQSREVLSYEGQDGQQ